MASWDLPLGWEGVLAAPGGTVSPTRVTTGSRLRPATCCRGTPETQREDELYKSQIQSIIEEKADVFFRRTSLWKFPRKLKSLKVLSSALAFNKVGLFSWLWCDATLCKRFQVWIWLCIFKMFYLKICKEQTDANINNTSVKFMDQYKYGTLSVLSFTHT